MPGQSFLKGSIDNTTKFIKQITGDHAYVHDGLGYEMAETVSSLAAGSSYKFSFTTPAYSSYYIHMRPPVISSSANVVRTEFFEDVTATGGDEIIPLNKRRESSNQSTVTLRRGVTSTPDKITIVDGKAGGNFGNQPTVDAVEALSSEAADTTQTITFYGTTSAALTTVTSETLTLTGSAPVTTTITNWQEILGIELSATTTGDITIREASDDATITTITAGATSAGVETPSATDGRYKIPMHDASGVSTKKVGIIGTAPNGSTLSVVDALNGTTEENHGASVFATITKVLIGDVASGTDVTILTPVQKLYTGINGSGGGPRSDGGAGDGSAEENILKESTTYVLRVDNIGSSTATDIDIKVFWYEEDA